MKATKQLISLMKMEKQNVFKNNMNQKALSELAHIHLEWSQYYICSRNYKIDRKFFLYIFHL